MISSDTPYKLSEIIRDAWPGIYRPEKTHYNKNQNYHGLLDCKGQHEWKNNR